MKPSEITLEDICAQVRVLPEELDEQDRIMMEGYKAAAISYVKNYTGLTEKQIDEHEDITVAILVLISDFYDLRQMSVGVNNSYENKTVKSILNLHAQNLLPTE